MRLERVGVGDVQLYRQVVHRGVVGDVRGAVQEQQPAGLVVGQGQVLGEGRAEREPGVDQPWLGVGAAAVTARLSSSSLPNSSLKRHALLDGVDGAPVEEVGRTTWWPAARSRSAAARTAGRRP